jgi:hypothetical protein
MQPLPFCKAIYLVFLHSFVYLKNYKTKTPKTSHTFYDILG